MDAVRGIRIKLSDILSIGCTLSVGVASFEPQTQTEGGFITSGRSVWSSATLSCPSADRQAGT